MHYQHAVEPPGPFTCLTGSKWPMNVWYYKYGQGLPLDVVKNIRLSRCNFKHAIDQGSLHTKFVSTNLVRDPTLEKCLKKGLTFDHQI